MVIALRWLAIVPAVLAVWWLIMLLGFGLLEVAIRFCPSDQLVSGMCMATWYRYVEDGIIVACSGLAAFLILAVSVLLAPSHRLTVASVILGGGVAVALYMAYAAQAWGSFAAAVLAGVIAWSAVLWWTRTPVRGRSAL
jgi:hypothetical protein